MKIATCAARAGYAVGRFAGHFAHGGLLTAGLFALVVMAANIIEGRGANPVRVKLPVAHAAQVDGGLAEASQLELADMVEPDAAGGAPRLSGEMARVKAYVARRYRVSQVALEPLLAEAENVGGRLGLDPMLLVAMIAIESSFNPFAESTVGAQGLMQVIPRFHKDKIGEDAGEDALFDPALNIRVGALVLKEGLKRYGSLQAALQYYGGALADPKAGYASKVLSMKARLRDAAGPSKAA